MKCEICDAEISKGALACPQCGNPAPKPKAEKIEQEAATVSDAEINLSNMIEITVPSSETGEIKDSDFSELVSLEPFDEITSVSDQVVPPGTEIAPQPVQLTNEFTGGYKENLGGPSVGGVGVQTTDDPFGLHVTEEPPPVQISKTDKNLSMRSVWNIIIIIFSVLLLIATAVTGIYYALTRNKSGDASSPENKVKSFMEMSIASNYGEAAKLAMPGAHLPGAVQELLEPYQKLGDLTLIKYKATSKPGNSETQVDIKELVVQQSSANGTENLNLLEITKPYSFPSVINMLKENGEWMISN